MAKFLDFINEEEETLLRERSVHGPISLVMSF